MWRKWELVKNRSVYLLTLPALLIYTLFAYAPMPGIVVAFKNYNFRDGIFGSPWHGLSNFRFFFQSDAFVRTTVNTLWINANNILWETLTAVLLAIFLNEIRNSLAKRTFQVLIFLPYFFSAIIIGNFVYLLFSSHYGLVNKVMDALSMHPVDWYLTPAPWVKILVGTYVWKHVGYSVVIYLATITGIDSELYEAACVDGASRFQQIRFILIPHLVPAVITIVLLAIGRIFFGNFQLIFAITQNIGTLIPSTDVIETYIYRSLRVNGSGEYGVLGAVGLYQSVIGFILVFVSNWAARKYDRDASLF